MDRGPVKDAASYYIQASENGGGAAGPLVGPGSSGAGLGVRSGGSSGTCMTCCSASTKAPDGTPLGRPPGDSRKAADIYTRLLAAEPHATVVPHASTVMRVPRYPAWIRLTAEAA